MEVLLQSRTCAFMEEVLVVKDYAKPIPYEQIIQVIYEKRYHAYDVVFYDEKNKKRTRQISCGDKQNEEAILTLLKDKVQNLEPRQAKRPIGKAGAVWLVLYVLFACIILLKFFVGTFPQTTIPLLLYPFVLLVNLIPAETFSGQEVALCLLGGAGLTFVLCLFSYSRSSIVIYEKKEL